MDATDSQKAHALDDYPIIKADAYIHGRPLSLSTRVCPNTEGGACLLSRAFRMTTMGIASRATHD